MLGRIVALSLLTANAAFAEPCRDVGFESTSFTVCEVDLSKTPIELFLRDDDGANYGQFSAIERDLRKKGKSLGFAMNAGMYHSDRRPVGHYVENGNEIQRLITSDGPGNFGLLPNGVFCVKNAKANVIETLRYQREGRKCDFATQSGPMLVIDGKLHPRFLEDSNSRFIRNGVGTSKDGQHVYFAISNERVTFHQFGRFFRDFLKVPQALYFDGKVSRLYAPNLSRSDTGFPLGPIIGTVIPAN